MHRASLKSWRGYSSSCTGVLGGRGAQPRFPPFFLHSLEALPLPSPCKGSGEGTGDEGSKPRAPKGPCVGAVPGWALPALLQGAGGASAQAAETPPNYQE